MSVNETAVTTIKKPMRGRTSNKTPSRISDEAQAGSPQANKNVPEIRFKGFNGKWQKKKLDEILKLGSSKRIHREDYVSSGIPFFRGLEISKLGKSTKLEGVLYISKKSYAQLKESFGVPQVGDILITAVGTLGNSFLVTNTDPFYFKDGNLIWLSKIKINNEYLNSYIGNGVGQQRILNSAAGSNQKALTMVNLKNVPVIFPCEKEQTAIGNTFQKLDSLINHHQQKHDKLTRIKKAMLEKMFPKPGETIPEIRFKGFSGEWVEKELGFITEITMGQSPNGENYTDNPNNHILVQGNADLKDGFVKPRIWTSEVTKLAFKGDLIFSVRAPVGAVGKTNYNVVLGRGVAAIKGNEFIYQQLKKFRSDNYWYKVSAGSTFDAISSSELASTLVWTTSDLEQAAIGNYFQKLDSLIQQHQQQISQLKHIKQACLSKMFV